MPDFWTNSGYALLNRRDDGHLLVTDDFLRAYFLRPEVAPVEESCDAERRLHAALLQNPREAVGADRLAGLADPDARENYQVVLDFRDRLASAETLEACYLQLFLGDGPVTIPGLFIDQMAHVIMRSILEPCENGLRARAGELFFREQTITIQDGTIMAADRDTVEMHAASGGMGDLGRLLVEAQTPVRSVSLDVLDAANAALYWGRESAHDTVLNLTFASDGLDAFARLLEAWIEHFLTLKVSVQPVQKISDERWSWHIGLDQVASRLMNDLYNGVEVGEARLADLLNLFRMDFRDSSMLLESMAGKPVYLGLCKTETGLLRFKPQNLLINLPLRERS